MSKYYDEIWSLIEKLDDINARLSDMLDAEDDRNARISRQPSPILWMLWKNWRMEIPRKTYLTPCGLVIS